MQMKTEVSEHSKGAMLTSELTSVGSDSGGGDGTGGMSQLMPVPSQFIVPVQTAGHSETAILDTDEPPEPKRLRVAEEEWATDS